MSGPTNTPVDPLFLIQYLQNAKGEESRLYNFLQIEHQRLQKIENLLALLSSTVGSLVTGTSVLTFATTGTYNDFDTSSSDIARFNLSANTTLTGIKATANGDRKTILNVAYGTIRTLTLKHQSASSVANNRIICQGGADIVLSAGFTASLWYDAVTQRWIAIEE